MPDRLLIRLHPDARLSWRVNGSTSASGNGAPPVALRDNAADIVVLVPAEDVLLTDVALAAKQRRQLRQAAPFAIEDQLPGVVEDQHVVVGDVIDSGEIPPRHAVAVAARERMARWLDRLRADGIDPDAILPDSLAIVPGSAVVERDRALVRLDATHAIACPAGDLDQWLRLTGSSRPTLRRIDDLLAFADVPQRLPLNLLDGAFAPRHRQATAFGRLRRLAWLAAAVVALAIVARVAEVASLRSTSARLQAATVAELQQLLPESNPATLAGADVAMLLADRMPGQPGRDGGVLGLLARLAPVIGSGPRIELRGIEYRGGTLELALRAPDIAALESLRERLTAQAGLSVEFTGSNPAESGVDGRLRIRGGGA